MATHGNIDVLGQISVPSADITSLLQAADAAAARGVIGGAWAGQQSSVPVVVSSASGVLTLDASAGNVFHCVLTENVTSVVIQNLAAGYRIEIHFSQDATGGHTVTGWPAEVDWYPTSTPTFGGAANSLQPTVQLYAQTLSLIRGLHTSAVTLPQYTALDPPVQEWNLLSVSDAGQLYNLASIPQQGRYEVSFTIWPGVSVSSATGLQLIIESPEITSHSSPTLGLGDAESYFFDSGTAPFNSYVMGGMGTVLAVDGNIWARRFGTYLQASTQTNLRVRSYFGPL